MAWSESPDTRLLHSLVRRRLALISIYSAQHLRDPWTVYVVRSKFILICGQLLTRKTEISVCGIGVTSAGFVCEGSIKASFPPYCHYLKSRFENIVFQAMNWFADLGMHLTSGGMLLNRKAQSDKAGCQTTCFSHRIGRNIWQFSFNGYLYLSYMWI